MNYLIDWELLLSHSHWVTINFNGKQVKLCARCFGTVIGFLTIFLTLSLIEFKASSSFLSFCIVLASPSMVDWLTQTWGLRSSRNDLRLITGFMNGFSIALLYFLPLSFALKLKALLYTLAFIFILGFIGKMLKQNRFFYK
ncbi:MAG: DUF2085 domain-containing protein [Candidatus Bathyarchaeia archaeon]